MPATVFEEAERALPSLVLAAGEEAWAAKLQAAFTEYNSGLPVSRPAQVGPVRLATVAGQLLVRIIKSGGFAEVGLAAIRTMPGVYLLTIPVGDELCSLAERGDAGASLPKPSASRLPRAIAAATCRSGVSAACARSATEVGPEL